MTILNLERFTPPQRAALELAAILETFDAVDLAALLGQPADALLEELTLKAAISVTGRVYQLAPLLRPQIEAALEAAPRRRRALYTAAARHYAARLAAAPAAERGALELLYMTQLRRCCEALLDHEPASLLDEALAAPIELLADPQHRYLVRYYRALGQGLRDQYQLARTEFEALLAEPDLQDVIRGRALNSSGNFARIQGDYGRARAAYQQSLAIWERSDDRERQGMVILNQGVVSYYLHDFETAERELLACLQLFRELGRRYDAGLALNNLGMVYREQGQWAAAQAVFGEAEAIFAAEESLEMIGIMLANMGEISLLQGQLATAHDYFERSLEQLQMRAYAVDVYLNLGLIAQARGDDRAALEQYRQALELALELGRHEISMLIHYRMGHAYQRLGDLEHAATSYDAALTIIEANRATVQDESLLLSLLGRWQQVYEAAVLLSLARGAVAEAFAYTERARARAFAELLARRHATQAANSLAPISANEAQATLAPGTLLLSYFTTGMRGPEATLLEALPPEAAGLRDCLAIPARVVLLALSSDQLRAHDCKLDPNLLLAGGSALGDSRRFLRPQVLRRLYSALLGPEETAIEQAEQLVIVPHAALHQLPFAALLDGAGQPLIGRASEISFAPSATLLRTPRPPGPAPLPCLAIGYSGEETTAGEATAWPSTSTPRAATPATLALRGRRSGARFAKRRRQALLFRHLRSHGPLLRHTEPEATAVAQLCGGEVWRGTAGVIANFRRQASRYRWIHLACHGEFLPDNPLGSWLQLGPGEQLFAADVIAEVQLRAELVTISACRSGVSRVLRGDEPFGLVRAFLSAGAQAVLVTLWPVEDLSARVLIERFYSALLAQGEQRNPAAALRRAQDALRGLTVGELREWQLLTADELHPLVGDADASQRPFADPAFWAPYILIRTSL